MVPSLRTGLGFTWLCLITGAILAGCSMQPSDADDRGLDLEWQSSSSTPVYERAYFPRPIRLPADHGPHPNFQTEWWYYTGNLITEAGARFGYQLTFFRRSLASQSPPRSSSFAATEIFFAHLAITDVAAGTHREYERFSRGAASLAGAEGDPFRVWLEDWSAVSLDDQGQEVRLIASQDGLGIDLTLRADKDLVAHGSAGLSQKGDRPGDASYYVSYTRMDTAGQLQLDGATYSVEGQSWFDHEWSTAALPREAVGWDWFGLQLDDGRELMIFRLRQRDGSYASTGGVTLVEPDGSLMVLDLEQVEIEALEFWSSPSTGASYPSQWLLRVPKAELQLEVRPWVQDQEMNLSIQYWEGAVRISGSSRGSPVTGVGYVELTGYAGGLEGLF